MLKLPPQQQRRSRIIIQLHPFSPELHPPHVVAAKSLIKSSSLPHLRQLNLFTVLSYAAWLGQFTKYFLNILISKKRFYVKCFFLAIDINIIFR